jgi:uncharacterized protein (TIGR02996 family)
MSPLEEALEKEPHDTAAFLVYADALVAAGDPHGELIHLQHALSKSPEDEALKAREWQAREAVAPPGFLIMDAVRWELGFPRELDITLEVALSAMLEAAQTPLARFIERVNLDGLVQPPRVTELLRSLPRLRVVSFADALVVTGMPRTGQLPRALDALPWLARLDELRFSNIEADDIDISALASSRHRAPPQCALIFEAVSVPFAAERRLAASWTFRNVGFQGPALLVEDPPLHQGKVLTLRPGSVRIGHGAGLDLSLPSSGVLQVHAAVDWKGAACSIRALGPPGTTFVDAHVVDERALQHGNLVLLGQAALRFLERDVDEAREKLKARAGR